MPSVLRAPSFVNTFSLTTAPDAATILADRCLLEEETEVAKRRTAPTCTRGSFNVMDFGAVGDGKTDDTGAFMQALEAAAPIRGTVHVPDGTFLCSTLKMPPHTGLVGNATWGYREGGGSVIRLGDAQAKCLIDITAAVGATVYGLSLEGAGLGTDVHGICFNPFEGKKEEDTPRIERCHIARFTGDGIHLDHIWCFSVRSCEIIGNKGNGLYVWGWDGFILDNWFSGNGRAGYGAYGPNASITMTGNRIEWNHEGGIRVRGGTHYNITGNYIDRSGGPAISLASRPDGAPCFCLSITGNLMYRSGKPEWTADELESTHVRFEDVRGLTFTGNTMCVGQDDGGGLNSPQYAMVLKGLRNSVIKDNVMHIGALKQLVLDLGGHKDGTIIADNVGCVFRDEGKSIWGSGQI
jgi:hypothetical protein